MSETANAAAPVPWYYRLLFRFFPSHTLPALSRRLEDRRVDASFELFADAERIDFRPLPSLGRRGMLIVLDNRLSLWFVEQDGHFVYRGYEEGIYEGSDISLVCHLANS